VSLYVVQALMERTVIFGVAAGAEGAAPAAGELMSRYASILAAQVAVARQSIITMTFAVFGNHSVVR
jgi:hypothetical protein